MIYSNLPAWLDIKAPNGPWCARIAVKDIHTVSLQPIVDRETGNPLEAGGQVCITLETGVQSLVYADLEDAQAEYDRIIEVIDGEQLQTH